MVESDEQLLHLSRYIHLNPIASLLVKDLDDYKWSSYQEYTSNQLGLCTKQDILNFFKSPEEYKNFLIDQIDYAQSIELIKHQLIDEV